MALNHPHLRSPHLRREARAIFRLAWPVMLTSLNWTLMHLIDVAIVGHAGTGELASLAAGRTLTYISIVAGLSALSGVLVFSARADGAGDRLRTGEYLRQGLLFGLALGLPCMVALTLAAEPLLRIVGVPPAEAVGGGAVVRAMAFAFPFQFIQIAASYFLEGVSQPRRVMAINLTMLPLNALLAWAWVGGHLGLPARGAVGAMLATSAVSGLGMIGMLGAAWLLPDAGPRGVRDMSAAAWRRALAGVPALLRFGWIPAFASGLELAGFAWLIILSTQLGDVAAAAFQTIFSLHNFAFSLALGFGSAAGVRAGNAVGAGNPGIVLSRSTVAAAMAAAAMLLLGLLFVAAGQWVVAPFSNDPRVVTLAAGLLAMMAPFMWFDGVQLVFAFALRSLGHQVAAGINGIIAFFAVTGGLGWYLVAAGVGPPALVYASLAGMGVAALLQTARMVRVNARLRPADPG